MQNWSTRSLESCAVHSLYRPIHGSAKDVVAVQGNGTHSSALIWRAGEGTCGVSHCLVRRLHPWQTSVVALIHFQHRQPFLKLPNIRRASNMISSLRLQVSAKQLMSNLTFLSINQCTSISLATLILLIHSSPAWGETNHSLNCCESNLCVKIMSHNAP